MFDKTHALHLVVVSLKFLLIYNSSFPLSFPHPLHLLRKVRPLSGRTSCILGFTACFFRLYRHACLPRFETDVRSHSDSSAFFFFFLQVLLNAAVSFVSLYIKRLTASVHIFRNDEQVQVVSTDLTTIKFTLRSPMTIA